MVVVVALVAQSQLANSRRPCSARIVVAWALSRYVEKWIVASRMTKDSAAGCVEDRGGKGHEHRVDARLVMAALARLQESSIWHGAWMY